MVFMYRFAIVPSLLLIPPVGVRIAKLALLSRRVDVASILDGNLVDIGLEHRLSELKYHVRVFNIRLG